MIVMVVVVLFVTGNLFAAPFIPIDPGFTIIPIPPWVFTGTGTVKWSKSMQGSLYYSPSLAIDSNGNIVLGGTGVASDENMVLYSFASDGSLNWQKSFDNGGDDHIHTLKLLSDNTIIAGGDFSNAGDSDWSIFAVDPSDGSLNWQKSGGGSGRDYLYHIAIDSDDNVYGGGEHKNADYNWNLISYNSMGGSRWTDSYSGGHGNDWVDRMVVDSSDNVIVGGTVRAYECMMWGWPACTWDVYYDEWRIVSYNKSGGENWTKTRSGSGLLGSPDDATLYDMAVDSNDNVVAAGSYNSLGIRKGLVVLYDSSGSVIWSKELSSNAYVSAVTVDSADNIIVGVNADDGNGYDITVYSFAPDGTQNWTKKIDSGNSIDDKVYDIEVDSHDNVAILSERDNGSDIQARVSMLDSSGNVLWDSIYGDSSVNEVPGDLAINMNTGDVIIAGSDANNNYFLVAYKGYPARYNLQVNINGSGGVDVSPSASGSCGSNCYEFNYGTDVTLTANPASGWTFSHWSGACSGSSATCVVSMASDTSVTAVFTSSSASKMPLPSGPTVKSHFPVETPVISLNPDSARPVGVGDVSSGNVTFQVGFGEFEGNVDIYIVIDVPGQGLQVIKSDNTIVALDMSSPEAWKTNTSGPVSETVFIMPVSTLPSGEYTVYVLVVPAGTSPAAFDFSTSDYYMWQFSGTL